MPDCSTVEIDGAGEPDCLVELGLGRSLERIGARSGAPQRRLDDERASGRRAAVRWAFRAQPLRARVARRGSNKL